MVNGALPGDIPFHPATLSICIHIFAGVHRTVPSISFIIFVVPTRARLPPESGTHS